MASPFPAPARRRQAIAFAIGLAFALAAMFLVQRRLAFLDDAQRHAGVVVDMIGSGSGEDATWRPVVRWRDAQGEHDTPGTMSSDPPQFELGESVGVYARPGAPESAVFDSPFSLWGWPLVLGAVALPFLAFGGGTWVRDMRSARRRAGVRRTGMPVMAAFVRVEPGHVFTGGAQARRIVVEWTDPHGTTHELRSADLGFDPTPWAKQRGVIDAWVDPADPRVHDVDVAFLPQIKGKD